MIPTISISDAARLLREGGVVAFPTETVYGLGANALDAAAVRRIYELKGRPSTSPLIVHVNSIEMAQSLASVWPAKADELATAHWPGPLSIVVPKSASIPDEVTAGLGTVGLRMPRHPIALALICATGLPLAAPSANRFTELSPTTAAHVYATFGDAVPVLDGGPCEVGLESTVVSVDASGVVRLLRPGMLTLPEALVSTATVDFGQAHESPGMHEKHYSPRFSRVVLVRAPAKPPVGAVYLYHRQSSAGAVAREIQLPADPHAYAAALYATLHELDAQAVPLIAIEMPEGPLWNAIRDRLGRAAS